MPSAGSPRVIFRCPPELHGRLLDLVRKSTDRRDGELNLSSLVVLLCEEGLAKRERSRTWRRRKRELQLKRQQQLEAGA